MTAVRRAQLIRFGTWVSLATIAVFVVILTARTESGIRRIATLITPAEPERMSIAPQIARRDQEEQRRLAETVRTLSADRDRLVARLSTLERNLDEVTGSIPPSAANPPTATPAPSAMPAAATITISPPATTAPQTAQPNNASSSQARVAAGHLATGTPSAAESTATRTEFGVDIGGNASIDGLRALWSNLKSSQPTLFEGLRPVIAIREGAKPGVVELRLVAGPLPNASIAARLCAALSAAGQTCQPAVFDGQRLALQ